MVSLNIPGESEMYPVSGLDTEQTPATIEWKVVGGEALTPNDITPASNCTSYLIVRYYSEISQK